MLALNAGTRGLVFLTVGLAVVFTIHEPTTWRASLIAAPVCLLVAWPSFYWTQAHDREEVRSRRDAVLRSKHARSRGVTARDAFPAPVLDVPIPNIGVATVRFFSSRSENWFRLRLRSAALERAPWLLLEGDFTFLLPAFLLGATAIKRKEKHDRARRYWQWPRSRANRILDSPRLYDAMQRAPSRIALVSRPGRVEVVVYGLLAEDPWAGRTFDETLRFVNAWIKQVQRQAVLVPKILATSIPEILATPA